MRIWCLIRRWIKRGASLQRYKPPCSFVGNFFRGMLLKQARGRITASSGRVIDAQYQMLRENSFRR